MGLVLLGAGEVVVIVVAFLAAVEQVPLQNAKGHLQMMGEKGSSSSTALGACRVLSRCGAAVEVVGLVG